MALLSDTISKFIKAWFAQEYSSQIAANSRKIKNYSLSTDYVHINLREVPGAEQIYCQGERRLAGIRNHSSAAFYQFYRGQNGELRIAMNPEGQTNLILTTENEGLQYLHDFTEFLIERLPDDRKEQAINSLGNVLALSMREDHTVCVEGEVFSHSNLKEYIFSDQETAALFLAYLLKYVEEKDLSEDQFLALLEAFRLKELYVTLHVLTRISVLDRGRSFRNFLLSAIRDDRKSLVIEAALGMLYRIRHRGTNLLRRNRRELNTQKLWRDIRKEYLSIEA